MINTVLVIIGGKISNIKEFALMAENLWFLVAMEQFQLFSIQSRNSGTFFANASNVSFLRGSLASSLRYARYSFMTVL
jgi:hypothetical protein